MVLEYIYTSLTLTETAYWEAYSAVALAVKSFLVRKILNLQYAYVRAALVYLQFQ